MRLSTLRTQHSDYEDAGSIPGLIQWVKDPALLQAVAWVTDAAPVLCCYGCGVGHRRNSDPALLWLLCRPAAVAQIQPLAWELPCAAGVALKRKGKKKKISALQYIGLPGLGTLSCDEPLCHCELQIHV